MRDRKQGTPGLIEKEDTVLVVIDMQERLFAVMAEKDSLLENVMRLIRFSKMMELPVIPTQQEKLGALIPTVREELKEIHPVSKVDFSCFASPAFSKRIQEVERRTLVLCGIEAHICVAQTALCAEPDFKVHVVADAVASRSPRNIMIGLERMSRAGITITSTEMFIYELLGRAGTETFREVLKLVK